MGPLDEARVHDAVRAALWTATVMSAPVLLVALAVGLAIGLLQALTSIQEMTLTFVPKLAAIVAVFWVSMAFMTDTLVDWFQRDLLAQVAGG